MQIKWCLAGVMVVGLMFAGPASGAVIAEFDFNDGGTDADNGAGELGKTAIVNTDEFHPNVTAVGDLTNLSDDGIDWTFWFVDGTALADFDTPTSRSEYLAFRVTPEAGYQLDISKLEIRLFSQKTSDPVSNVEFAYVIGAGSEVSLPAPTVSPSTGASRPFDFYTVDTTGISALQGVSDTFEFRVYYQTQQGDGSQVFSEDALIEGNVALIPEPASLALMGLGGLFIFTGRRRHRAG